MRVGAALGTGGAGGHDCQKEHEECMEICWSKRYPWPHNKDQSGWYYKRCISDCETQYIDCIREQEEAERERTKKPEFSDMNQAIDWVKNNKARLVLGSIIIVGGVAFVLATTGAGALVLAPLVL